MKEFFSNLKFACSYLKNSKKKIPLIIITTIIRIAVSIIGPILSAKIVVSLTSNNYDQIILVSLMILVIETITSISYYLVSLTIKGLYKKALSSIEVDLGKNVLKIENEYLDENGSGVFIQRLTNDTSYIANYFGNLLEQTTDFIRYIGILVAIFLINKIVFVYVICVITILYILEDYRTKKRNEDNKEVKKLSEKVTGIIGELVRGARDIKMLNSEKDFINELSLKINAYHEKNYKMQKKSWTNHLFIWEVSDIFDFILILLLVVFIKKNIILPALALVLYNYYGNMRGTMYFIADALENITDFNLSCKRVKDILYSDEFKKEKFGTRHIDKINGDFEFKNVSFAYKDKKVLNNLSFKIKANETAAFVGKSGAGKTTIFNLLCKMYDIDKGKITIDGINIKELDKDSIRGNITIISQNPYIFNMSIRDNFRLVKSDLTEDEMIKSCKIACLSDFIETLPDGYDTLIGEGGINLSGGQKQRLAIARALIQKTEIILFDEATSALDNETQARIQQAIENMKSEYTILIIAHRLSTIINSDRILFLDNGKIVSEGKHSELLSNCEEYRKLYESEIIKKNN